VDGACWFSYAWSWLILRQSSPVKVTGLDKIDTSKPHLCGESRVDARHIPVLYTYLPFQFPRLRKELLSYPVVGWQLKRSGQVCIDQQNPAHSISSINAALKA
jgi:1-acyl-sn-glycerol-3-phosphate acyltransferase